MKSRVHNCAPTKASRRQASARRCPSHARRSTRSSRGATPHPCRWRCDWLDISTNGSRRCSRMMSKAFRACGSVRGRWIGSISFALCGLVVVVAELIGGEPTGMVIFAVALFGGIAVFLAVGGRSESPSAPSAATFATSASTRSSCARRRSPARWSSSPSSWRSWSSSRSAVWRALRLARRDRRRHLPGRLHLRDAALARRRSRSSDRSAGPRVSHGRGQRSARRSPPRAGRVRLTRGQVLQHQARHKLAAHPSFGRFCRSLDHLEGSPATIGMPTREIRNEYQSGRPSGAKHEDRDMNTSSRKLVPQRG